MRGLKGAIAAMAAVLGVGCDSPGRTATIVGPTGGEVCIADDRVCLIIPGGALDRNLNFRIFPTTIVPPGAFLEGFEIEPSGTRFALPARVVFKIDPLYLEDSGVAFAEKAAPGAVDPLKLRLFTKYPDGDWEPLATPVPGLDRVRRTLSGSVVHLSPFVILRGDRLPDGGVPLESDGGR